MTPQEAVDYLVRTGVDRNDRNRLRRLFNQVATTAKNKETRRCAVVCADNAVNAREEDNPHEETACLRCRDDILTTGRLEAAE